MKLRHLAVACMLSGPVSVALADGAEITVTGVITPSACETRIDGAGEFEMNLISFGQLNKDRNTRFQSDYRGFSIDCPGPLRFGLRAIDAKTGSNDLPNYPEQAFGVAASNGNALGGYLLEINKATLNIDGGTGVRVLKTSDMGQSWSSESSAEVFLYNSTGNALHGFTSASDDQPAAITKLTGQMRVDLRVLPLDDLDIEDEITYEGNATLELSYL